MRRSAYVAGALATGVLLASCGTSPAVNPPGGAGATTNPYTDYASLTGKARTKKLLADAAKQGSALDLYTSNTDIQDLLKGFKKAYPNIKVRSFRANSETVLQRITQESQAGKPRTDIVDTNDLELRELDKAKLLTPYHGPALKGLKAEARGLGGWTAERFNAFVIGWNTSAVHKGEAPKSLTELAEPKWKGKLSLEVGDWDWYASAHTYLTEKKGMSEKKVDALFKKIVANAKVTKGHTVQGEFLSAGQFGVALSVYSHTVDKAAKEGAPVAWHPAAEPVILRPNGIGLLSEAKHPAAAMLWADWVLGPGQKYVAQSERIPAARHVPGVRDPIPADTKTYSLPKTATTDGTKWNRDYDALLRGVPVTG